MSLSDIAGGILGKLGTSGFAGQIESMLGPTIIQTILDQLNQQGLGAKVNSWLGKGANEPITADELRQALGNQKVQEIARQLGLPADQLAEILAQHLPQATEKAAQAGALSSS